MEQRPDSLPAAAPHVVRSNIAASGHRLPRMSERFLVQVDADQFDRLARSTQPLAGVTELLWNALDAEADIVTVSIARNELDGVDVVQVEDDGHGMTHADALRDFRRLGGSWKKNRSASKSGNRPLHGKEGAGRFRAFAIGSSVEWSTVAVDADDKLYRTVVTGSLDSSEFTVSEPEELAAGALGTMVRISRPREYVHRLLADDAATRLVIQTAVYLVKYPNIRITYDGTVLDPAAILDRETSIDLDPTLGGEHGGPTLRIMEWKPEAKSIKPSIILCHLDGVALNEITDDVDTRSGIPYTAYLTWAGFTEHVNDLLLADFGNDTLKPIVDAARSAIRDHIDTRLSDHRAEQLDRWKADQVYPYAGQPTTVAEAQERRVFDVVATAAAPAVSHERKAARLSLRLIREALSQPPGALHRVLKEVLDLTAEQLSDFDELLERTSLASVIYTSKLVTDRLDFIVDLDAMLFDRDKKTKLLERTQLHRILANGRTWVFGEQYAVAVDDQGLTKVLQAHRTLLGDATPVTEPVTDSEGYTRIVDLMLSKAAFHADRREHLVVELKRPSLRLTQTELNQITNYAVAVSKDERFKSADVSWEFWLLGDDMDDVVRELVNRRDQPSGLYTEGANYRIWARRWAEIIEENRQRLHFYRDHLQFEPRDEVELEGVLSKYLPQPEATTPAPDATPA